MFIYLNFLVNVIEGNVIICNLYCIVMERDVAKKVGGEREE